MFRMLFKKKKKLTRRGSAGGVQQTRGINGNKVATGREICTGDQRPYIHGSMRRLDSFLISDFHRHNIEYLLRITSVLIARIGIILSGSDRKKIFRCIIVC